jgi:hypothetical protein
MSIFERSGHWRTNAYGTTFWVESHYVCREGWDIYVNTLESHLRAFHADQSYTAHFVRPNAKCPVCGADVFFYQNAAGSRVFFDELGPPWPKHPCTDNNTYSKNKRRKVDFDSESPKMRDSIEIDSIIRIEPDVFLYKPKFLEKYRMNPCVFYSYKVIFISSDFLYIVACKLNNYKNERLYLKLDISTDLDHGGILFISGKILQFFDIETLNIYQGNIERIQDATDFIDCILNDSPEQA